MSQVISFLHSIQGPLDIDCPLIQVTVILRRPLKEEEPFPSEDPRKEEQARC